MSIRKCISAFLPVICICFAGCGGVVKTSNSAIDGNWKLFGQGSVPAIPPFSPYVGMALGVNGNTIYAAGSSFVPCSQQDVAVGGDIGASAQIAADGSFELSNASFPQDSIQFTIKGKVPPEGTSTWQGAYTLVNASNTNCVFNLSGDFTATAYPSFQGTYSGGISGTDLGSNVGLTLTVAQGAPDFETIGPEKINGFHLPLSGTLTVSGSSCFTSGTFGGGNSESESFVAGDSFAMNATMNDGSSVQIQGWFGDATEKKLEQILLIVEDGQCKGANGGGILTLQ